MTQYTETQIIDVLKRLTYEVRAEIASYKVSSAWIDVMIKFRKDTHLFTIGYNGNVSQYGSETLLALLFEFILKKELFSRTIIEVTPPTPDIEELLKDEEPGAKYKGHDGTVYTIGQGKPYPTWLADAILMFKNHDYKDES